MGKEPQGRLCVQQVKISILQNWDMPDIAEYIECQQLKKVNVPQGKKKWTKRIIWVMQKTPS